MATTFSRSSKLSTSMIGWIKVVTVVFCALLVLVIMPINVEAKEVIDEFEITYVPVPEAGKLPIFDHNNCLSTSKSIKLGNSKYYVSLVFWTEYISGKEMYIENGDVFEEGRRYVLWLSLKPIEGYEFANVNNITVSMKNKDMIFRTLTCIPDEAAMQFVYRVPLTKKVTFPEGIIGDVKISNVVEPLAGEKAVISGITVPSNANYTLNFRIEPYWQVKHENEYWHDLDGPFEIGKNYRIVIPVVPKTGYEFGDADFINCTVNGKKAVAEMWNVDESLRDVVYEFPTLQTPRYTITASAGANGKVFPTKAIVYQGRSRTFTFTPDFGYEVSDVLVDGVSVGAVTSYTLDNVTKNHKIEVTFKEDPSILYLDVFEKDWFYEPINYVTENGLMKGIGDRLFDPLQNMTKSMIVTVLYNLEGNPVTEFNSAFTDVKSGDWFANSVSWATINNIDSGNEDGTYMPNEVVTREYMAWVMINYLKYKGIEMCDTSDVEDFVDLDLASSWAVDSIRQIKALGIMKGKGANDFDPKGFTSRSEFATVMMNFHKIVVK